MLSLYLPGTGWLHRLRASTKLIGLVVFSLVATIGPVNPWVLGTLAVLLVVVSVSSGVGLSPLWEQIQGLRWVLVVVLISQLLFLTIDQALGNSTRMLLVILMAGLVTLTTRSRDILDTLERALGPFARFGINPVRVSLVLSITIRTVPVIAALGSQLRDAQRARGGPPSIRAWIVPLVVGSLRQADELADALVARGVDD